MRRPHVFISYIRENSEEVERLANELRVHGVKVWLDKHQIKPGYRWKDAIRDAISQGDYFIACFSEEYHKRSKTYFNEELILAIDELRQRHTNRAWFIPVLLSQTHVPDRDIGAGETLRSIQWVELYENWDDGIRSLLSVIQPDAATAPQLDFPALTEDGWKHLFHQISHERFIPIVGPGFGYGVLPYDTTLAREMALKYGHTLEDLPNLAEVAQLLSATDLLLPKELIRDRYREISPPDFSEDDEPHAVLAKLPIRVYITANYDDFLEQALRAYNKDPVCEFSRWNSRIQDMPSIFDNADFHPTAEMPVVFHMYGHTKVPESIVITEDDFREFLIGSGSEVLIPLHIRSTLAGSFPLVLGFNLSDDRSRDLFHALVPSLDINVYRHIDRMEYLPGGLSSGVREYLERYFPHLVGGTYWGTLREFMDELRMRWDEFSSGE